MKYCFKICFVILIITIPALFAQPRIDAIKNQANSLIRDGRYKEAIDQLNKYISSNPREAEGYHLRGLCYEKTTEYQYSVLDLRRARSLDPQNQQIKVDLDRVITIWHELLYKKIEGHKRDLAIDPKNSFTYLEIGKSYRWLEEWNDAEIWYDKYLERDDNASPDEIIRYTEILAKTGSITKGEKILKKYVERYPDDWRLWSRYGYFTLWLGKNKIAEEAFSKALGFKPFFKEAQDGMDLVKNQAYLTQYQPRSYERVYPIDRYYGILKKTPEKDEIRFNLIDELINANRYDEAYQQLQLLQNKYVEDERFKSLSKTVNEYRDSTMNNQIAVYTDSLKNNPNNKNCVLKLSASYANLFYYDDAIRILEEYLSNVPEDQDHDARFQLAKYCAWNYEWEKAISILNRLIELEPDNLDYQLLRGQIGVWTVLGFDIAEYYLLNVVANRPESIDAYLALSSLYAWKKDFPESRKFLDIAKRIAPNSVEVEGGENNYALHLSAYEEQKVFEIRQQAAAYSAEGNCAEAVATYEIYKSKRTALSKEEMKEYATYASCAHDYAKAIAVYDTLLQQEYDYDIALHRARDYYNNGDTTLAMTEMEKLSRINPDDQLAKLYLADAYTVTNQLDKSELIFRELRYKSADTEGKEELEDYDYYSSDVFREYLESGNTAFGPDSSIMEEAKNQVDNRMLFLADAYVKNKKFEQAENIYDELQNTSKDSTVLKDMPMRKMFLGDAYTLEKEYGKAKDIYYDLLDETKDTAEIHLLEQRISWMPPSGFQKGIYGIGSFFSYFLPTNIGIAPFSNSYNDNQDFSLWNYGVRVDAGFLGFLGLGASWNKSNINTSGTKNIFTSLKGLASLFFSQRVTASGSLGVLDIPGEKKKLIGDITLRYDNPEILSISGYYENNDARLLLFSPSLNKIRLKSEVYRLTASYQYKNQLRVSGHYSYYEISDGNFGNDLQFRFGRSFVENAMFGYEYFFSDYAFVSSYYYSPQEFASHSIWGEYLWSPEKDLKTKIGGKIGYVPKVDFMIGELFGEVSYNPVSLLKLTARLGYSNSYRYDSSYQSISALFSIFWSIY
jgi:tetratricopeptide (TPR) repeat protein